MAKELEQEKRERATFILNRANAMNDAKQYYASKWRDYEKIWKMFDEKKEGDDAWRENLPDTWAFATIKTAQSAFVDSKVVPIITRHEDDDQMMASDLRDLYTDISEKGEIDTELYFARLDAFKLGMGFLETTYVEDKRKVMAIDRFDPDKNTIKYKESEIKDFDDPKTFRLSPYLVLVDDMATSDYNSIRDAIKIEVLSRDDAKDKYGHLVPDWDTCIPQSTVLLQTADVQDTGIATTSDQLTRDTSTSTFRFFAPLDADMTDDKVEILHYYSKNMGVKRTDTRELIINGYPVQVDTKSTPSPIPYTHKQIPITPIPFSPYSGDEFWAAGLIEIGLAEATALKKFREMMADRQKLSLFSPAFSDVNDEFDQKALKLRPLSVIRTRGGAPKQYQIPGVSNADFALQDRYEAAYKRAVGVDERVLGTSGEGSPLTATEVSLIKESAMRRLREFAFLYKKAILREVKLKNALFKQYYSSPMKRESHVKGDKGVKRLKVIAKQFKKSIGDNVYTNRNITEAMFHDNVDIDVDMRILVPMTPAEMITKWAQVMRDTTPYIQAGLLDLDIEKMVKNYLDAMEVNIETLRKDESAEAIMMAEGEHRLFASSSTSEATLKLLPEGTPSQFLTAQHLVRHMELMEGDDNIGEAELRNLVVHIAKDRENLEKKMAQQAEKMAAAPMDAAMLGQVGGLRPPMPAGGQPGMTPEINAGSGQGLMGKPGMMA